MEKMIKHKGILGPTGQRIILLFEKIPDDPTHCLVLEYDRLTDAYRQNILTLLESPRGQEVPEFYMALTEMSFGDGMPMLNTLHQRGYITKAAVKDVILMPNNSTKLPLDVLLQVKSEGEVKLEEDINDAIITADLQKHEELKPSISNKELAEQLLSSAKMLESQANKKKEEAYVLCPELRPSAGRPKLTKSEKDKRRVERNRMRRERYAEMVSSKQ